MNYSEKYKQNLKNFNKYQRTRIDYDRRKFKIFKFIFY